jgi:hypothetical protein
MITLDQRRDVDNRVQEHPNDGGVPRTLVEDLQTLVGSRGQGSKRGVLEGKKGNECDVAGGDPAQTFTPVVEDGPVHVREGEGDVDDEVDGEDEEVAEGFEAWDLAAEEGAGSSLRILVL